MLKLYHARQGEVPSRAVCTVVTEASEITIEASPKLKNSQILENLTPKLAHSRTLTTKKTKGHGTIIVDLLPAISGRTWLHHLYLP